MVPPPPPPPAPPPPPLKVNASAKEAPVPTPDRNALLSEIRIGAKLKKAVTNDRSAPIVNGKSGRSSSGSASQGSTSPALGGKDGSSNNVGNAGHMLAGLFAQGMPKLRPTNNSFLKGGAYKSQLDPRETIKRRSLSKSCDDLGVKGSSESSSSPANTSDAQEKPASDVDVNTKANSVQNLNVSSNPNEIPKTQSFSSQYNQRRQCPEPPPASKKPSFVTSDKSFAVKSFLHNDELGGSEPNLNAELRSKPLPDTPLRAVNRGEAPTKPAHNRKSYEDSDVPNTTQLANKSEKLRERALKYSTMKNTSMPSDLNGRSFASNGSPSPVVPLRKFNRNLRPIVKPSVAPPPLPVRAAAPAPPSQNCASPTGTMRVRPPPPPAMSPPAVPGAPPPPPAMSPPAVPGPPPPPPRNLKNTLTLKRNVKSVTTPSEKQVDKNLLTQFEARFQFKDTSEFPKPEIFSNASKTYPSRIARQARKKVRQLPPNARPPPPPVASSKA